MNFSLYDESSLTAHIKLNNCGHEYDYAVFKPILYTIPFAFPPFF